MKGTGILRHHSSAILSYCMLDARRTGSKLSSARRGLTCVDEAMDIDHLSKGLQQLRGSFSRPDAQIYHALAIVELHALHPFHSQHTLGGIL